MCAFYLSNLQYWVNVVQVQRKLIVLHVVDHLWAANVVEGFLKPNSPNTQQQGRKVKVEVDTIQHVDTNRKPVVIWPLGRTCREWCGSAGPPGRCSAEPGPQLAGLQALRRHSRRPGRRRRKKIDCPTEEEGDESQRKLKCQNYDIFTLMVKPFGLHV